MKTLQLTKTVLAAGLALSIGMAELSAGDSSRKGGGGESRSQNNRENGSDQRKDNGEASSPPDAPHAGVKSTDFNQPVSFRGKIDGVPTEFGDHQQLDYVSIDVGGQSLQMHRKMFPGKTDAWARENLPAKIKNGIELYHGVLEGPRKELSDAEVTDLMWALHTMAEQKSKTHYKKGSMTVPDPDGRLWMALTGENSYGRMSSHLKHLEGKKQGRDFTFGDLPYGMRTILLQEFKLGDHRRLFLKMETRGSKIPSRDMVPHLFNYVLHKLGRKDDGGLPAKREKLPARAATALEKLKSDIKAITGTPQLDSLIGKEAASELRESLQALGSAKDVATIHKAIGSAQQTLAKHLPEIEARSTKATRPALSQTKRLVGVVLGARDAQRQLDVLQEELAKLDHHQNRIGDEVVMTGKEVYKQGNELLVNLQAGDLN